MTLKVEQNARGEVYVSTPTGNTYRIRPHPRHGIEIEPVGASLIPYCLAIAERRDLCDLRTHQEGNRMNEPCVPQPVIPPDPPARTKVEGVPDTDPALLGRFHLPTSDRIDKLPCEAPWMSGMGMCLIKICALRIGADGKAEACLADEAGRPYLSNRGGPSNEQFIWYPVHKFPREWPQ